MRARQVTGEGEVDDEDEPEDEELDDEEPEDEELLPLDVELPPEK